jgi:pimeloyl-[acyl-carrier protein] methyl ester esterase
MSREAGQIHRETHGNGKDVVLVHGWGMHSGVWRDFALDLAGHYRVTLIDLPGHGHSGMIPRFTLAQLAPVLLDAVPERAHWLGWSLGGTICLYLAGLHPERVVSLTMMTGNARFTQAADWPQAMDPAQLSRFADDMMLDYRETLMKFLVLQTWGLDDARSILKQLRERVYECDAPDLQALQAGLDILRHADLREDWSRLALPSLLLTGGRDRLVPAGAAQAMQALNTRAEAQLIESAAHVPFITHSGLTRDMLVDFWRRHD